MSNRSRSIRTRVPSTKNRILKSPERRQRAEFAQVGGADGNLSAIATPFGGPAKLRKYLALSDGSDTCATENALVGWGGSGHKGMQYAFSCWHLVECGFSMYRQKYRHSRRLLTPSGEQSRTKPPDTVPLPFHPPSERL
jgi:hypothetical protein